LLNAVLVTIFDEGIIANALIDDRNESRQVGFSGVRSSRALVGEFRNTLVAFSALV
jgi:hypothetical protein